MTLKKTIYVVELSNLVIITKDCPMTYFKVVLDCKRGKFRKSIESPEKDVLNDENPQLKFDDQFLQASQFYESAKKGTT